MPQTNCIATKELLAFMEFCCAKKKKMRRRDPRFLTGARFIEAQLLVIMKTFFLKSKSAEIMFWPRVTYFLIWSVVGIGRPYAENNCCLIYISWGFIVWRLQRKRVFLSHLAKKVPQKVGEAKKNTALPFPLIPSAAVRKYFRIINNKSLLAYQCSMKFTKFLKICLKIQ